MLDLEGGEGCCLYHHPVRWLVYALYEKEWRLANISAATLESMQCV